MEDAGPYGCRAGWTHYTLIQLNVIRAPETTTRVQISTSSISPYSSTEHTSTEKSGSKEDTSSSVTDHQISSTGTHLSTSHRPSLFPSQQEVKGSFVIIVSAETLVLLLIAVPLIIVAVRKKKNNGLLSSTIVVFNPVIYEQIKDTGRFCNPEDRDTETTVFYSCV
ncbi:hypothetical protein PO909_016178 [Leuciscus waleckii]